MKQRWPYLASFIILVLVNSHQAIGQSASNVQGYKLGIISVQNTQKALFPYRADLKFSQQGYAQGIAANIYFQSPPLSSHYLAYELSFLQKTINSMEVDLLQYLKNNQDRRSTLNKHLEYLKDLERTLNERQSRLAAEIILLNTSNNQLSQKIKDNEDIFFRALPEFQINSAVSAYEQFIETSKKEVAVRAHLGALQWIESGYQNAMNILPKLISAIEQNKEALIQGIVVTEIENIDLGIIKKAPDVD